MKIGIISDIHENFHNLILALEKMNALGVKQIICLGDLMNDGVAKLLATSGTPVFMVWGNNDGDKVAITKTAFRAGSKLTVSDNTYDFPEFEGRKLFLTHHDNLALPMASTGIYDAVFYGHTHHANVEKVKDTIVVNPGEISAQKTGYATLAIYDTNSNEAGIINLENSVSLKTELTDEFFRKNKNKLLLRSDFSL